MLQMQCPHCGKSLQIEERYAGQGGRCNKCGQPITAPALTATPPPLPKMEDASQGPPVLPRGISSGVEPGFVDGKHYTEHVGQVKHLKREGMHSEAIALLLRLIEATERESRKKYHGCGGAPWYYEQLAIIYRKEKRYADEVAVLKRYLAQSKATGASPVKLSTRLEQAKQLAGSES